MNDEEILGEVIFDKDKFYFTNPVNYYMPPHEKNINDLQNKIWYVIKHEENTANSHPFINTNEDYNICLNDIVKLGRVKYSANEINLLNKNEEVEKMDESLYNIGALNLNTKPVFDFIHKAVAHTNQNEDDMCKICLSSVQDESNPLANLCKCTGGYSHYECIKMWMQTKLSTKENEKKTCHKL